MRASVTNRFGTWEIELHEDGRLEVVSFERKEPLRGLGDVVARVTKAVGIPPCPGCERRRADLNRAVPFPGATAPAPGPAAPEAPSTPPPQA